MVSERDENPPRSGQRNEPGPAGQVPGPAEQVPGPAEQVPGPAEQVPGPAEQVGTARPIVVGICAAVESTASLEQLFEAFSSAPDAALVLVLQAREAFDDDRVRDIVGRASSLRQLPLRNGTVVEAGAIYVAAANDIVTLAQGVLHTRPAGEKLGARGTIDSFLLSLAEDEKERAMAVVLHGTGSDGALGVAAVKENGGLTVAEHIASEADPALAAIKSAAALADFLLSPDRIPERIALFRRHLESDLSAEIAQPDSSAILGRVAVILRKQTRHDFSGYKHNTFMRRIKRRMKVVEVDTIDGYLDLLGRDESEVQNLFNDLLISVTRFFRDAPEFEALQSLVLPKLFEKKGDGDQLRVWVLGCATGEEAYSIAILLREFMATLDTFPHIQIFATDIDNRALASARIGRYSLAIADDMPPERLARWFVKEGDTYCIVKEVREMCIFSAHNVIRDAPFSRLDLISCRNLLIYFDTELQTRVIPLFHFALRPTGYLFLGNSENVTRHPKLFEALDRRSRLFRRLDTGARTVPDFPISATARYAVPTIPPMPSARAVHAQLAQEAEIIAARYTPAYVIVDEHHDVLHFSGRTGHFIDPASGAANLNIFSLIHPDLRLTLKVSLQRALETNVTVRNDGLRIGQDGSRLVVDMSVEPIRSGASGTRRFVVLFNQGATVTEARASGADASPAQYDLIHRLEGELSESRGHLQTAVEELESTNEELKSSNEEYQSLNEELQSANEELETSKEEMQSINEELTTVNDELAQRVLELGRVNSDIENLFESTQIATIFLDNDLRVRNYTPAVTEIFHLVETDIGRPITHIKSLIAFEDLQSDVRRVMRSLGRAEREMESSGTGIRYLVRVLPYRSLDNFIAGIVITFVEVTSLTRAEEALRESERRLRAVIEGIPQLVWRSHSHGAWSWSSPQWTSHTGLSEEASLGRGWLEAVHPDDRVAAEAAWEDAHRNGELAVEYRIRNGRDGSYRWFKTRALPLRDEAGEVIEWLGTSNDVEEFRESAERQSLLLAELQHRVRNTLSVIRSIARRTAETSDTVEDYAMHLDGRISAFGRVQAVVTRDPAAGVDLEHLVAEELLAYRVNEGDQVDISGPSIRLKAKAAESIGLALHELATNAVKHGTLSRSQGGVRVAWRVETTGALPILHFDWVESGVNTVKPSPRRRGFGTELLERALRFELDAVTTLAYEPTGLHCTIELPLTDRVTMWYATNGGKVWT